MPTTKTSGSLDYELIQKGVDDLKAMSGGRIEITLYPIKALVGTAEMLDALSDGHFETAQVFSSYFTGTDTGFAALASLAGLYKNAGEFQVWHDPSSNKVPAALVCSHGVPQHRSICESLVGAKATCGIVGDPASHALRRMTMARYGRRREILARL